MKRTRYAICLILLLSATIAWAQKPQQTVAFSAEALPAEVGAMLEKASADKAAKKENARIVEAFAASYSAMEPQMKQRLVGVYTYAVRAKLKADPEVATLTRVLTAYATAPQGGMNFEGWVAAIETMSKKNSKAKYLNEFVGWSDHLLDERVLYRSATSEWVLDASTPFRLAVEDGKVLVHVVNPTDLNYASNKDWNTLHGTRGTFDYREGVWHGTGGRLDWARTGLGAEACYADLKQYDVEVKFPKFKADSVSFVNTHYFSAPIIGRVEEALQGTMEPEKYTYPRFRSYQRDFVIPNIMTDVDYSGTFMMNGSKFITASSKHPARLVFHPDGREQMSVTSLNFTLTPERLTAENAQVSIAVGEEDSIWGNGLLVRYMPAERKVTIVNDARRKFYSPLIDTYHELDIYSESITWLIGQGRLDFGSLASSGTVSTASFESSNCYTYKKYREIQGIDEVSPVRRVYDYAEANTYNFGIKGFSNYIGLDMSQTLLMIHTLCRNGLVSYNEMTGRVLVKQKLEDYAKANAKAKGFDYDALALESTTRGTNARMSLSDYDLLVRGVEQFVVSDTHRVVVFPDSASGYQVHVGRNRALHFSGRVECNKFILKVTDADYSYEQHRFELPQVDKMEFYVPDFDNADFEQLVRTPLTGLVGSLEVDAPNNHSGLKKNKEYPIFTSRENCYVYYDRRAIQGGQYRRQSFYYTIAPFRLPSLANFKVDSLQFGGSLTSAGIFPEIKEPLKVQRDYFLGFRMKMPKGGMPVYGGKGTYHDELRLDAGGLHGPGHVDYLTSHASSRNFLFLPDSTLAITDTFVVRESGQYPAVQGGRTSLHWLPYLDSLDVATPQNGTPLAMYRGDATLDGHLALMPQGVMAGGTARIKEATLESARFDLLQREMDSRVSSFVLRSNTFNNTAFEAHGVQSKVDYDSRQAELTMPDGPQRTELALLQYEAWADFFSWDMDKHVLDIANSKRLGDEGMADMTLRMRLPKLADMPGARFVSTDPARRHLTHHATRSTYHYEQANLSCGGVYLIAVADAAIAPAADSVHIIKGGEMRVLNNASLLCNRDSAFHLVSEAYLVIESSDKYTGKGYITYPDESKESQRIYLSDISVQGGQSIGQGSINDEANFELNRAFGFAGKVRMEADRRELYFDGGVRLMQDCINRDQMGLLAFADYADPEHVRVMVPELPTDWRGKRISAALLLDKSTLAPQPAFLTVDRAADNELLTAHGVLTFLGAKGQYMIASEEKIAQPESVVAPYLALNTGECAVEGEGPMDFTLKRTQATFYTYGTAHVGIKQNVDDVLNTVYGFTFPLASDVIEAMRTALKDDLRLVPTAPRTAGPMRRALMYHLGAERGAKVYAEYSEQGKLTSIPEAMRCMVLLDQVRWQHVEGFGWYADSKAGLMAVDGKSMGLEIRFKAQINKRGNSQQMTIYLEAARDHWYFFRFDLQSQELTVYSSVGAFEDAIKALPADKRRVDRDGLGTFRYHVGNNKSEVSSWLTTFSNSVYSSDEG